jgi:Matrixin
MQLRLPGGRSVWPVLLSMVMGIVSICSTGVPGIAAVNVQDNDPEKVDMVYGDNWDSMRTFRLTRNTPLKIYIDRRSSLYRSELTDAVTQSLDAWSDALGGRLTYNLVASRAEADITVDWTARFSDPYTAGMTDFGPNHATVLLRVKGIPDSDITANLMHEFGHAFGIAGHSSHASDIMVGSRQWRRNGAYEPKLSSRDVQAIRRLYGHEWHRGEDLYTTRAQEQPVAVKATRMPVVAHKSGMPIH